MIDNSWIFDIDDIVLSEIETYVTDELITEYPDLFFTTTDYNESDPMFPTVVIKCIDSQEVGQTLEGDGINAVMYSIQVDVYANTKQQDAKKVMGSVINCLKKLRFDIFEMPEFNNTDVYRMITRARRVIGANDII